MIKAFIIVVIILIVGYFAIFAHNQALIETMFNQHIFTAWKDCIWISWPKLGKACFWFDELFINPFKG